MHVHVQHSSIHSFKVHLTFWLLTLVKFDPYKNLTSRLLTYLWYEFGISTSKLQKIICTHTNQHSAGQSWKVHDLFPFDLGQIGLVFNFDHTFKRWISGMNSVIGSYRKVLCVLCTVLLRSARKTISNGRIQFLHTLEALLWPTNLAVILLSVLACYRGAIMIDKNVYRIVVWSDL